MSKLDTSAHSLNNSTSKMTYSFPKSNRFLPSIKPTCDLFYDVPLQRSKRSTSFGIGNKMSMSIDTDAPPPGTYTQASDFEGKNKKRGFSFGYGRDETVGGPLDQSKHGDEVPGPGTYPLTKLINGPAISLKSRMPDFALKRKNYIPGPGAYDPPVSLNAIGKYVSSNHLNSRASRFSTISKSPSQKNSKRTSPGPGDYSITEGFSKQGKYMNSRYQNAIGKSFGKQERVDLSYKHMKQLPGPGTYKPFSEFDTIN